MRDSLTLALSHFLTLTLALSHSDSHYFSLAELQVYGVVGQSLALQAALRLVSHLPLTRLTDSLTHSLD